MHKGVRPQFFIDYDERLKAKYTPEQYAAITAKSSGVNLLVSAGAGSGKTTVMIERIVRLLLRGEASLDRMAICTFTTASAADMLSKLSKKLADGGELAKLLKGVGGNDLLARHRAMLPMTQIGTIDSFCMKIVRRAFYLCDLDPAFTVLEAGEADALKSECADALIAQKRGSGDEGFDKLYAALAPSRSRGTLKESLLAAVEFSEAQPSPEEWLLRPPQKTDAEYRSELLTILKKELEAFLVTMRDLRRDLAAVGFAKDAGAIDDMLALAASYAPYAEKVPQLSPKEKAEHPEFEEWHEKVKDARSEYNRRIKAIEGVGTAQSHEAANELCKALGTLGVALREKYAEAKKARHKVDYADLEHYALDILSGEHGKEIASEYDFVFVDEYQDVNPLQEKILNCFHGCMFFVGDVKQSIYGFRMCTPDFFVEKRKAYKARQSSDGSVQAVDLRDNFRSGKTVLDFVNAVFAYHMKQSFGGTDYASESMTANLTYASAVSAVLVKRTEAEPKPPTGVYSVREDESGTVKPELRTEVSEVVQEIERLVNTMRVPERKEDGTVVLRSAAYGDIAVLVRSNNIFVDLLREALLKKGIPACFEAADMPADEFTAVNDLLSLLRLLDNAEDDVSLVAAMLSRAYGGFTESELAAVRRSSDAALFSSCFYAYAKRGKDEVLREKAAAFVAKLNDLRQKAASFDIATLAGEITAMHDAFTVALAYGGEREAAALDAYIEHLSALTEHDTLHDYLAYLKRAGVPKLSSPTLGSAVRIMTVHKAKGLEFPFVILANLEKAFNRQDATKPILCDKDEGIVLQSYDFTKHTVEDNPRFSVGLRKLHHQIASEELRILYVAMTRAQYHLSLISLEPEPKKKTTGEGSEEDDETKKDKTKSFLEFLYEFIKPPLGRLVPEDEEGAPDAKAGEAPEGEKPPMRPRPPFDEALVERLTHGFGEKDETAHGIVKASVSGIVRGEDEETASHTPTLIDDDRSATARGTAYHLFMEHVRFGESGEWERLCARYPEEGALVDRTKIERAFAKVSAFIKGRPYYREQPFVYRVPAAEVKKEGDDILVQGVVDLLIEDGDGLIIVDYKTGSPERAHLSVYGEQLNLYAAAASRILGKKVCGTYLYWFESGKFADPNEEKSS